MVAASKLPSPSDVACFELVNAANPPQIKSGCITSIAQLEDLWRIDKEAYGEHSLEFEPFLEWWNAYPYGSRCLFLGGNIVASIGIYPLSQEQFNGFVNGEIAEGDLVPCLLNKSDHWYFSGMVILPEYQNRGLARRLLRMGVGGWIRSGHLEYPAQVCGLAQTEAGRKALELMDFKRSKTGSKMPDGLSMYRAIFRGEESLSYLFRGW